MKLSSATHVLSLGSIVAVTNADFNGLRRVPTRTAKSQPSHRKLLELSDVGANGSPASAYPANVREIATMMTTARYDTCTFRDTSCDQM